MSRGNFHSILSELNVFYASSLKTKTIRKLRVISCVYVTVIYA
jgi:hypothetical protein